MKREIKNIPFPNATEEVWHLARVKGFIFRSRFFITSGFKVFDLSSVMSMYSGPLAVLAATCTKTNFVFC